MANGGQMDSNQHNSNDVIGQCVIVRSCDPCIRNKSSKTATVFCKDCNELFCDQCSHLHTIFKPGKHEMVSIQNMDSVPVVVDMKGIDRCQEHGKEIEFHCKDHGKLCCSTCAFIHRICDQVDEISSVSGQNVAELHALKKSLIEIQSVTESILAECKQSENELNESIENISKEVDEIRDRIIKLIEDAKQKLLIEANQVKSKVDKRIGERHAAATKIKEEIPQILSMCSAVLEHGTPQQKYIFSKMIEEKQKLRETQINEQRRMQITTQVTLSLPSELSALLEMENNILKLNYKEHSTQTAEPSSDSLSSHSGPVTLELLVSVDLPKTGDDGKKPLLTGMDFLSDGRLVVVDDRNMKCIILNDRLQRRGTPYKFKSYPYDVVCISQNELAVTAYGNTVCLLSVSPDNAISLIREIDTSSQYDTICCKSPSHMVVSTNDYPRPVRMISVYGVESDFDHVVFPSKTYEVDESKCTYVQTKNTLVLTDRFAHTVYMYDTVKGTSRAVTDKNIREPRGVCVGPGDTVLVCSEDMDSIVHLTADGDILGTYPVDMEFPYSLCVSEDGCRLAVSNNAKGTRKLQLYKISPARS